MSANGQNDFYVGCETVDHCPNCDGTNLHVWRKGYDRQYRVSRQEFTYSKCLQCDLIFLSSRPIEGDAHHFYPGNYGPYQQSSSQSASGKDPHKKPTLQFIKKIMLTAAHGVNNLTVRLSPDTFPDELQKFYRPESLGARLLDFGCGTDGFLNHARHQGWDTLGMDVSLQTVEQVHRSGHQALLVSPSVWNELEDDSIDMVRMNHVLEHLYNSREVLATIRSKMRTGARLHIALPNPASFPSRLFRSRWFPLDCPRHVILYSPPTLKRLLKELGFSDLRVLHQTITKDSARSLGHVLHDCGWIGHEQVMPMMHRQDLSTLFFTPARLAALWGAADRFHIFARK